MSRWILVLSLFLLFLAPSVSFAETPPPAGAQSQIEAPVSQPVRGLIETGAGTLGGGVGGVIGLAITAGYLRATDQNGDFSALGTLFLGGLVGFAAGIPLAVYFTGYLLDGDGSPVWTALASVGGLVLGVITFAALVGSDLNDGLAQGLGLASMGIFGAGAGALAFELTSPPSRKAAEAPRFSFAPVIAPAPSADGVVLGLTGRF